MNGFISLTEASKLYEHELVEVNLAIDKYDELVAKEIELARQKSR